MRAQVAAERADREHQPVQVVVDVEVAGEAGAGVLVLVPAAVAALRSTSQATPRVDRVGVGVDREQREQRPRGLRRGRRRRGRATRGRRRSAGPRPSRRRRSGACSSQRTARARVSESRVGARPRPAPARPRRCRRRSWRPSGRTTSRRPPGRRAASARRAGRTRASRQPACASISTTCAVTSADGGSITAPKSQNGSFSTRRRVLSASNAPQPPSRDCMPTTHSSAALDGRCARRAASSDPVRRSASTTSAVSSMSG